MNNEEKNIKEENNQAAENASIGALWNKLNSGVKAGIIAAVALILIVPIILVFALSGNGDVNNDNTPGNQNGNQDDSDTKISYSVTVKDEDGNPIKDAKVSFFVKGGVLAEKDVKTDANGKAAPTINTEFVSAKVTYIPVGYDCDKLNVDLKFDANGKINVTVKALSPYVVKVVDQDGNAIAGVMVQMCDDVGSCRIPQTTDADGCVSYPYEEGTFHAQLTALPDGYTVDDATKSYNFEDNLATIVLTKI